MSLKVCGALTLHQPLRAKAHTMGGPGYYRHALAYINHSMALARGAGGWTQRIRRRLALGKARVLMTWQRQRQGPALGSGDA